jgi:hypothetical protein
VTEPETMDLYCTNAVGTSQGADIGAKTLPVDEAQALIAAGVAVAGSSPPMGFLGPYGPLGPT